MKKLLFILMACFCCLNVQAELTVKQVFQKSVEAADMLKGIQGKCTVSAMGQKETMGFATNGAKIKVSDKDGSVSYANIPDSISHTYDKEENTITISRELDDMMVIFPFIVATGITKGDSKDLDMLKNAKISKSKTEYEIKMDANGVTMVITIDANTFLIKEMAMKKFFVTIMSMKYTNITSLSDPSSLDFDQSKYPTAKIIDKRNEKQ